MRHLYLLLLFVFFVFIIPFAHATTVVPIYIKNFSYVHINNITLFSITTVQGHPFYAVAEFTVQNATFPIYVYLAIDGYVYGSPIMVNTSFVDVAFYLPNGFPAGLYSYNFIVVDSQDYGAETPSAILKVYPPLSSTIKINGTYSFETGQTISITADATGGMPPYTYIWYINNILQPYHNNTIILKFYKSGTYNVTSVIYDSYGDSIVRSMLLPVSNGVTFTYAIQKNVEVDEPDYFSLNITGGVPPYKSYVIINGVKQLITNNYLIFNKTGTYNVTFYVVDSMNSTYEDTVFINVIPDPHVFISVISMSNSLIFLHNCYKVNAIISDGMPPYKVYWLLNGKLASLSNPAEICAYSTNMQNITVLVYDKNNMTASSAIYFRPSLNSTDIGIIASVVIALIIVVLFLFKNKVSSSGY